MMRIFISTGEVSGDIQGALLAKKIKELAPETIIDGFGGIEMKKANVNILSDMSTLSSVGILEGINPKPAIKKINSFNLLKKYLKNNKIDLMILVDNQGANLILAKYCKKNNIKYVYYFPPHVGIWGVHNAKRLMSSKKIITPFMFDYEIYKKYNCNVMFSGHPFIDLDYEQKPPELQIEKKEYTIGVLFGSRYQEIQSLSKTFINTMKILNDTLSSNVRFIIPIAYPEYKDLILNILEEYKEELQDVLYTFLEVENKDYIYTYSDVLILSSGTSTLLAACYGKPMVICYKISKITFFIAKIFTKIKFIGMPNILLNKEVVPELLQQDCNPTTISNYIIRFLLEKEYYNNISNELLKVRNLLGEKNVLERVAKEVLKIV